MKSACASYEYVWGRGLIGQITSGGSATYAQSDGLGSIRLLTDGSGNVVGTQQYDAYGASRPQSGVQLPFGFDGEQVDAESGLVYLRARYYDPSQGRFLTQDPLGFVGSGVNLYAYAGDNPVVAVDPSGLDCLDDVLGGYAGFSCLGGDLASGGDGPSSNGGGEGRTISRPPSGPTAFGPEGEGRCELAADTEEVAVIGRQSDTKVALDWPGHEVLNIPDPAYTEELNRDWVQDVISGA